MDLRLPGSASRFDYQDIDTTRRRLYVAHLGASDIDVVDMGRLKVAGVVRHLPDVHGVRAAPDIGRVYASATRTDTIVAIDAATLAPLFRAPTRDFPDGLAYDPDDQLVFVSDKNAGAVTTFDAHTGASTGTTKLADETGNVVYDPRSRTVYAAARPPEQLVSIDPATGTETSNTRLSGCAGAHGVYLEESARLAFVACERNARLTVVDLATMHQLHSTALGEDPDVLAYDTGLHRLYVASESGVVTVFELRRSRLAKIGQAKLADHAHSVAVDQATHRVFFPLENVHAHPVLRVMQPSPSS